MTGAKLDFLCSVTVIELPSNNVPGASYSQNQFMEDHYFTSSERAHSGTRVGTKTLLWILLTAHLIVFVANILKTESGSMVLVMIAAAV